MMDKVYIVKSDSGQYDDWHWWIEGIFDNPQDAEALKDKILIAVLRDKEAPCPIEGMNEDSELEGLSDETIEVYFNWWNSREHAKEFNNCSVKEYPLNKPTDFNYFE